ncbi:MAG: YraN family protein [Clostridia bacterium]|nr:YraN family protein [Oscillospiraceae bacterium]MBO5359015.1 YraN family protein [Clostridia bacterium]
MNVGEVGIQGEKRVAHFLRQRGFNVIKRNYQCRFGEIDIIAENGEYILFVEVKTRKQNALISGVEAVDSHKQSRITLSAQDYISKTLCEKQPRFDVAEVTVCEKSDGSVGYSLKYIENAF